MANFITKIIDSSIERIANKSHTLNFTPQSHDTFRFLDGFLGNSNKSTYDLAKLLDLYESHPLVFEVIDNITQNVSRLPLYTTTTNDVDVSKSKILPYLTNDLKQQIIASRETCGNAFLYFRKGVGAGAEIEFWVASNISITTSTATGEVIKVQYTNPKTSKIRTIEGQDLQNVLHIKDSRITRCGDVNLGMSKLTPMYKVVSSSLQKFIAEEAIFKNRGIAGILSNNSDIPLLEPSRKAQQDEFDRNVGGADKFNKLYVTSNRVHYVQLGMSPTDLKLLEGITESLRRIASAYHLSSVLFNDVANSKFDNMEEAIKQAYLSCYIPTAEKIYEPLSIWLSKMLGVDEVIKVDRTQIEVIKSSTNTVAMALNPFSPKVQEMIISQMTRDEARELIELGSIDGGSELVGKLNTTQDEQGGGN